MRGVHDHLRLFIPSWPDGTDHHNMAGNDANDAVRIADIPSRDDQALMSEVDAHRVADDGRHHVATPEGLPNNAPTDGARGVEGIARSAHEDRGR